MITIDWSLVLLLTIAVWFDLREDRIPNALIYVGMSLWLLLTLREGNYAALFPAGKQMGLIFLVTYPVFKIGGIGAGDIKLFMMSACYMYEENMLYCLCFSLVLGAILGMIKLWREGIWLERYFYFRSYVREVVAQRGLQLYQEDTRQDSVLAGNVSAMAKNRIHFSLPIFIGVVLKLANVY